MHIEIESHQWHYHISPFYIFLKFNNYFKSNVGIFLEHFEEQKSSLPPNFMSMKEITYNIKVVLHLKFNFLI